MNQSLRVVWKKELSRESLIVEMVSQASIGLIKQDEQFKGRAPRLKSIQNFETIRPISAPNLVRAEVDIVSIKKDAIKLKALDIADSVQVSSLELICEVFERPSQPKLHATATIHPTAQLRKRCGGGTK